MTIAEYLYNFVVNVLFGTIADNAYITEHLDELQGQFTVLLVLVVLVVAIAIVWGVWRLLGRLICFWDR